MQFVTALLLGVLIGVALVRLPHLVARASEPPAVWPRWLALAVGAAAAATFGVAVVVGDVQVLTIPSIALPIAGLMFAVERVVSHDRRWQVWLGLAFASVPVLFWGLFVVGEFVSPH